MQLVVIVVTMIAHQCCCIAPQVLSLHLQDSYKDMSLEWAGPDLAQSLLLSMLPLHAACLPKTAVPCASATANERLLLQLSKAAQAGHSQSKGSSQLLANGAAKVATDNMLAQLNVCKVQACLPFACAADDGIHYFCQWHLFACHKQCAAPAAKLGENR